MNRQKLVVFGAVFLCVSVIAGCGGGGGGQQSGFNVQGQRHVQVAGGGFQFFSITSIQGNWLFDNGSAIGETRNFGPFLCGQSSCRVDGGRVPARWRIVAGTPGAECIGYLESLERDVTAGSTQVSRCVVFGVIFPFTTAPASVDLQAPPATFDLTGSGLSTAYGMPQVEYVDQYTGAVIGSTTATAVNADGTWLQATMPDLSSVYSGTYNILISNVRDDGSREYIGTSTVDCYGRDVTFEPPPDPGPCGCPPDGPCMPCENYY